MRALRLVAAILAAVMASTLAPQAGAATDSFTVGNVSAQAGRDEMFTVTRISGGKGIYVLFETSDDTAHAGTDYTAVKQLLYFRASQISGTVIVHTAANSNALGQTLAFNAIIASSTGAGAAVKASGSIIEAPPPLPLTQTCPDGSVILATATCPAPVPVAQWVTAPFTNGGYARCKNLAGCRSDSAPCPLGLTPPAVCSQPDVIAKFGEVWVYAWNGWSASTATDPGHAIGAFWPIGEYKFAGVGVEGPVSDWEGVAPAP